MARVHNIKLIALAKIVTYIYSEGVCVYIYIFFVFVRF